MESQNEQQQQQQNMDEDNEPQIDPQSLCRCCATVKKDLNDISRCIEVGLATLPMELFYRQLTGAPVS